MKQKEILAIVDAPEITLAENEEAGEALLKFYRALGWNGEDNLDPCKVITTEAVYYRLHAVMYERCPNALAVGAFMVNKAPSTDADVPPNKVQLLFGWVTPAKIEGS